MVHVYMNIYINIEHTKHQRECFKVSFFFYFVYFWSNIFLCSSKFVIKREYIEKEMAIKLYVNSYCLKVYNSDNQNNNFWEFQIINISPTRNDKNNFANIFRNYTSNIFCVRIYKSQDGGWSMYIVHIQNIWILDKI